MFWSVGNRTNEWDPPKKPDLVQPCPPLLWHLLFTLALCRHPPSRQCIRASAWLPSSAIESERARLYAFWSDRGPWPRGLRLISNDALRTGIRRGAYGQRQSRPCRNAGGFAVYDQKSRLRVPATQTATFTAVRRPMAIGSNLEVRCNNWDRQRVKSPSRNLSEPELEPDPEPSRT